MFKKPEIVSVDKRVVAGGESTWACGKESC